MSYNTIYGYEQNKRETSRFLSVEHGDTMLTIKAIPESFPGSMNAIAVTLSAQEARILAADLIRRADEIEKRSTKKET